MSSEIDYELMLYDRVHVIRDTIEKYGEENFYISFSGGEDSTVLHHLVDEALPNNKIPRVFINTGIEHLDIVRYVKELAKTDDRFVILNSNVNIRKMLEEKGYPFKSKEHSLRVDQFNKGTNANYIPKYLTGVDSKGNESKFRCPKKLLYQFEERGKYNYSNQCCNELKKKPIKRWQKENHRPITITGMLGEERGNRARLGCIITERNKVTKFHPLIKVSKDWEEWYIKERNIKLCRLYYPPFNFKRTGCLGCPFNLNLQKDLDIMEELLPNERKQCEILWKPVYDEYRRIGYRLKNNTQTNFL